MRRFSNRQGIVPINETIQKESMSKRLRNSLWNALTLYYFKNWNDFTHEMDHGILNLIQDIWMDFFGRLYDDLPNHGLIVKDIIKDSFFKCKWYDVYDLIEFIPGKYVSRSGNNTNQDFFTHCNNILEEELSAYRFINGMLTPITSDEELKSIEESFQVKDDFKPVKTHLKSALKYFSDRKSLDYRNSIKESISAVESYCSILTGETTLGKALKKIKKYQEIHPALEKAFEKLYGYTSDSNGIRHALLNESKLEQEDAHFMLVTCSAFINYLKQKSIKEHND